MKFATPLVASIVGVALVVSAYVTVAAEPESETEAEPTVPDPPKITHENLYQMEALAEQGADPNAHYFLYPGIP